MFMACAGPQKANLPALQLNDFHTYYTLRIPASVPTTLTTCLGIYNATASLSPNVGAKEAAIAGIASIPSKYAAIWTSLTAQQSQQLAIL